MFFSRNVRVSDVLIARNRYGVYAIPSASAHRPAAQAVLAGKVWEEPTIEFMREHCSGKDVVTAGAFFGDALPALSQVASHVWAFEPNPESFRCAHLTMLLNNLRNVTLTEAGSGSQTGAAKLTVKDFNGKSLGGGSQIGNGRGHETVAVAITMLDEIIGLRRPISVLHLDVEGYEEQALLGAIEILGQHRPSLLLETIPSQDTEAGKLLADLGYRNSRQIDHQVTLLTADSASG